MNNIDKASISTSASKTNHIAFKHKEVIVSEHAYLEREMAGIVVSPAYMRALIRMGIVIECEELYIDLDTVPEDFMLDLLSSEFEEVYVFSSRHERVRHHPYASDIPLMQIERNRDKYWPDRFHLVYRGIDGSEMKRCELYNFEHLGRRKFGIKGFVPQLWTSSEKEFRRHIL